MIKKVSIIGSITIIAILIYMCVHGGNNMKKKYEANVEKNLLSSEMDDKILTNHDISYLPEPVQKYLNYVGVVDNPKVENMKVEIEGEMKQGVDKPWMKVKVEQHNFYKKYARLFYIKGRMFGIHLIGTDSYIEGKGNMTIKLASLVKVVDESGEIMDKAALVTLLNDMCILSPAALVDNRIKWEAIDRLSAKCSIEDGGNKAYATLYFNDKGELINFETYDREFADSNGNYVKAKWSTPIKDYKTVDGITYPTYGEAVWHLEDGDFTYAKFNVKDVKYNVSK